MKRIIMIRYGELSTKKDNKNISRFFRIKYKKNFKRRNNKYIKNINLECI